MRRTSPFALILTAIAGAAVGWLLQVGLTAEGALTVIPPATLYSVLFILAFGLLLLGRPVRRLVRGKSQRPVDPFYAMRVLVLAKASGITGALLVGAAASFLGYAVSRAGSVSVPAFWPDVLTGVGALALCIAGLIVEWWCRIPPQDRSEPHGQTVEQR
ncbi:DUF3180 domain-containing protein [uncultured Amnibacterium sp.]|uniref:DUF3180 domain-containing protein n=1 Tax=uncultured Amnibacterium sp. TaxID=1631851 RepID=UPI0035CA72BA